MEFLTNMSYKVHDFNCQECGKQFEKFVKTTEGVECPFCGSVKTQQQLSATSFKVTGRGTHDSRMKV